MRLLLTRPKEDSDGLASALAGLGVESRIEPLLSVDFIGDAKVDLDGVQALLITSANGVRAFAHLERRRDIGVLAVGDASARAAREAGFTAVESASGDVDALAGLVKQRLNPKDGALLHVAGSVTAGDLAGLLERDGYTYKRAVLYSAGKAKALTLETVKAFRSGELDGVVFFSPRTAETFVSLARKARLQKTCGKLTAFCLSPAVAAQVSALKWKAVETAEKPEQDSLLDRVRTVVKAAETSKGEDMTTSKNDPKKNQSDKKDDPKKTEADKKEAAKPVAEAKDAAKPDEKNSGKPAQSTAYPGTFAKTV